MYACSYFAGFTSHVHLDNILRLIYRDRLCYFVNFHTLERYFYLTLT